MRLASGALAAAVLAAASAVSGAQEASGLDRPIQRFLYDYATGEVVLLEPGAQGADVPVPAAYDNSSCALPTFGFQGPGEEWMDVGVKATGLSGVISAFSFGYSTTAPTTSLGVNIYTGSATACVPGTLVGSFVLLGLPGSPDGTATAFAGTADISASAICVPDGPIGWGYVETGGAGVTGPLFAAVGGCPSGTTDSFTLYTTPASPGTCFGTIPGGTLGPPGTHSFYFDLTEDDGSTPATATFRNTTNPAAYTVTSPPNVCGTLDATIVLDPGGLPISLIALGVPDPGSPNPFGAGDLLVAQAPFPVLDVAAGTHSIPVPPDVSLIGAGLASQGFRWGPGAGIVADALNAYDLVIGT